MPTRTYRPTRTTTDITIAGEDWYPIQQWLKNHCRPGGPPPQRLFVADDAQTALQQFMRRTARLSPQEDLDLRLRHDDLAAFGEQMRFWESCMDEIHPTFRSHATSSPYFQIVAFQIEGALQETFQPIRPPTESPICSVCGDGIAADGIAQVDLNLKTVCWHHECA